MWGRTPSIVGSRAWTVSAILETTEPSPSARHRSAILLGSAKCPCADANSYDQQCHPHFSHALEIAPPCSERRSHSLKQNNQDQGRCKPSRKTVDIGFQRGKIQKSGAGRMRGNDEYVVIPRGEVGRPRRGRPPMRRRGWWLVHGSNLEVTDVECLGENGEGEGKSLLSS